MGVSINSLDWTIGLSYFRFLDNYLCLFWKEDELYLFTINKFFIVVFSAVHTPEVMLWSFTKQVSLASRWYLVLVFFRPILPVAWLSHRW